MTGRHLSDRQSSEERHPQKLRGQTGHPSGFLNLCKGSTARPRAAGGTAQPRPASGLRPGRVWGPHEVVSGSIGGTFEEGLVPGFLGLPVRAPQTTA